MAEVTSASPSGNTGFRVATSTMLTLKNAKNAVALAFSTETPMFTSAGCASKVNS